MAVGKEWILEADGSLGFWHCHKLIGLWVSFLIHKLGMRRERTFIDHFLGIFILLTSLDGCQLWTKMYRAWSPILPCAKSLQSYLTLCNPTDCSPPGSSAHGILQAGILEWVAVPSSRGSSQPRNQNCISYGSCIAGGFFATESLGKPNPSSRDAYYFSSSHLR